MLGRGGTLERGPRYLRSPLPYLEPPCPPLSSSLSLVIYLRYGPVVQWSRDTLEKTFQISNSLAFCRLQSINCPLCIKGHCPSSANRPGVNPNSILGIDKACRPQRRQMTRDSDSGLRYILDKTGMHSLMEVLREQAGASLL